MAIRLLSIVRQRPHHRAWLNMSSMATAHADVSATAADSLQEPMEDKYNRQLHMETLSIHDATAKYEEMRESLIKMGKTTELGSMQKYMIHWYIPLVEAIQKEQQAISNNEKSVDRNLYGPFLAQLGPDKLAVITMNAIINASVIGGQRGAAFSRVSFAIGHTVEAEVNLLGLKSKYGKGIMSRLSLGKGNATRIINNRAKFSLENDEWTA